MALNHAYVIGLSVHVFLSVIVADGGGFKPEYWLVVSAERGGMPRGQFPVVKLSSDRYQIPNKTAI